VAEMKPYLCALMLCLLDFSIFLHSSSVKPVCSLSLYFSQLSVMILYLQTLLKYPCDLATGDSTYYALHSF